MSVMFLYLSSPPLHTTTAAATATAAAALYWDLSDDAVVERSVAEAVLEELCQETQAEVRELQEQVEREEEVGLEEGKHEK